MTTSPRGLFDEPPGATPLSEEDKEGLIPSWIALRSELNAVEREGITDARAWAFERHGPWTPAELLSEATMSDLHKRMFGRVWKWAGDFRTRETNIGVPPYLIRSGLHDLLEDVRAQAADPTCLAWTADELAIRFHHWLVLVHAFPNGNGRHGRLAADLLVRNLGGDMFTWGGTSLDEPGTLRERYLAVLRIADRESEYRPLVEFARS